MNYVLYNTKGWTWVVSMFILINLVKPDSSENEGKTKSTTNFQNPNDILIGCFFFLHRAILILDNTRFWNASIGHQIK